MDIPPSDSAAVNCSIIIRAYNEERHLGRLLRGIAEQSLEDIEIILVDSGSTDRTIEIAERWSQDFLQTSRQTGVQRSLLVVRIRPEDFTFGYSLNQGLAHATRDLVVFASAHVYPVYPDWLENLLKPFIDPQVALVYGKQRGGETNQFSEHQVFAHWFPDQAVARQATPFCNNANAAIRRRLWQEHPFDESLPGLEDLGWAHWAMSQGYCIAYTAEAEIIHVHDEKPAGVYNRYRREAMAFKRIFPHERFRLVDFIRLSITNILSDLWHATRERVLWRSLSSIFWFRLMQFWGTYQGYRHTGPLTWHLRQTFYYPRGLNAAGKVPGRVIEPIQYDVQE